MAIKVVKKSVAADVEVEKNKTIITKEQIPVGVFDESKPTANVGFGAAYTKNLGNYESLKITVSLFMPTVVSIDPSADNTEAIDAAFLKIQSWVDKKVNDVLDELNQ